MVALPVPRAEMTVGARRGEPDGRDLVPIGCPARLGVAAAPVRTSLQGRGSPGSGGRGGVASFQESS